MSEPPNQTAANKLLRVLRGDKPLRLTVRVHKPGGEVLEFQCERAPEVVWMADLREFWVCQNLHSEKWNNEHCPVVRWGEGFVMTAEENPKT